LTEETKLKVARPKHLSDADEAAINKQLDRMHAVGIADRDKVSGYDCTRWKHYTDFALGRHWEGYDGDLEVLYTDNRIGRNLRTKANLVNEMHIGAEFEAREPGDEVPAALQNAVKDLYWEQLGIPETLDRVGMMADRLGTGLIKVHWDPQANEGLGDLRADWWPTDQAIGEPGKVKFDDMRWFCTWSWLDQKECETKYGGKPEDPGEENKNADMGDLEDRTRDTTGTMYNVSDYDAPLETTTTGKMPADSFFSADEDSKKVLREEWWVKDDAIEVTEGDEGEKTKKKKYPGGRLIVRVGKQIVVDKKNPYDHGKWPYAKDIDELDPKRFWGDTSIRHAIPVQKEHDVCFSIIANNMHLNTNTPWINPFNSGIDDGDLQTQGSIAGGIIRCRPNAPPSRMPPTAISHNLFDWYDRTAEEIDNLMEIQQVIPPGARGYPASGEVIEQLRESQLVKIRARANNRARCVQRVVELLGATVAQFYTEERYIRIVGPLPEALRKLAADSIGDEEGQIRPNGSNGYFVKVDPKAIARRLDVRVIEAVWEPLSKKSQIDQLTHLMELQERVPPDAPIQPEDIMALTQLGTAGDQMQRRADKRKAEMAAAEQEAAQAAQPMGPDPNMQGPPPVAAPPVQMMGGV
jgi:hypothetical protein